MHCTIEICRCSSSSNHDSSELERILSKRFTEAELEIYHQFATHLKRIPCTERSQGKALCYFQDPEHGKIAPREKEGHA
jgi:hypothetical protein